MQFHILRALLTLVVACGLYRNGSGQDDEAALTEVINKNQAQSGGATNRLISGLQLDASVVLDTFYYYDNSDEGLAHIREEISGFGHSHGTEDHDHAEIENGFNLRHVELGLSAEVDPYFRAWTTLAIEDGNAEIEEAVMQTTALPGGFTLQAGKFFSGIGRINRQHSHEWEFFDQPLVYALLLGHHGLQETGVQLTWLAPTSAQLLWGVEAFNGENEQSFQSIEAEELPKKDGPRLWTTFLKYGPDLGDQHGMQLGLFAASGYHQEAHDGDGDGTNDHWLHGRTTLWGADAVYKYDSRQAHGAGDLICQTEYFNRKKDMEVWQDDLVPALTGRDKVEEVDGYYVQAIYGIAPRWRAGLRWEQVGLLNRAELPDLTNESYDPTSRTTVSIDWKLSEFSILRMHAAYGDYTTNDDREKVWEFALQWSVTFGKHPAHSF